MAKHATHKRTSHGKRETLARKARRAAKYAVREIDFAVMDVRPAW